MHSSEIVRNCAALGLLVVACAEEAFSAPKYESWSASFPAPVQVTSMPARAKVTADPDGKILFASTETAPGGDTDIVVRKFDRRGNVLWKSTFNGVGATNDFVADLKTDAAGNVYVCGTSTGMGSGWDYVLLKYDHDGTRQWVTSYDGPEHGNDLAVAMSLDRNGNAYLTGQSVSASTAADFVTFKCDSAGNRVWVAMYNSPYGLNDQAAAIAVDAAANVYVTGTSTVRADTPPDDDYATVKYSPDGSPVWVARLNGSGTAGTDSSLDRPVAMVIGQDDGLLITGNSFKSQSPGAFGKTLTVKYDLSGNELWKTLTFSEEFPLAGYRASGLTSNRLGNVIVFGTLEGTSPWGFAVEFDPHGALVHSLELPSRGFGASGAFNSRQLVTDSTGNLYVSDGLALPHSTTSSLGTFVIDASGKVLATALSSVNADVYGDGFRFTPSSVLLDDGSLVVGSIVSQISPDTNGVYRTRYYCVIVRQVFTPPAWLKIPDSEIVNSGAQILFSGMAAGSDVSFQWSHDGDLLSGATNADLRVSSVSINDAGGYRLEASNPAGSVASIAALTVDGCAPSRFNDWHLDTISRDSLVSTVSCAAGKSYSLQVTTNLTDWSDASQFTTTNGLFTLKRSLPANGTGEYFRLRESP